MAGWRAVETLRAEGFTGTITLVGEELHLPYDRPPLSKQVLAGTWPPEKAVLADRKRASELRVHEVLGHRAVRLDVEKRQVEIDDGTVLSGDAVIVATGASPRHLPGTEGLSQRDGLFTLRTLDDSRGVARRRDRRRVVPRRRDRRRVHRGRGGLDLRRAGVPGHRDRGDGDSAVQCAGPADRRALRALCTRPTASTCGPGVAWPASTVSRGQASGLDRRDRRRRACRGRRGGGRHRGGARRRLARGFRADAGERRGLRRPAVRGGRVVAAGDVARWTWRHDGDEEQIRIEHWQVAAEAGVAAARSLLAGRADAVPFTPVPYFWSDQFGIRFQVLGNPGGEDEVEIVSGSFEEGKFVALFGRAGRLRAVMAIGRPRQLMGYRPLLEAGSSWDDALAHAAA